MKACRGVGGRWGQGSRGAVRNSRRSVTADLVSVARRRSIMGCLSGERSNHRGCHLTRAQAFNLDMIRAHTAKHGISGQLVYMPAETHSATQIHICPQVPHRSLQISQCSGKAGIHSTPQKEDRMRVWGGCVGSVKMTARDWCECVC